MRVINKYVQKSKVFLFPLICPKNVNEILKVDSYMEWEGNYVKEDYHLTVIINGSAYPEIHRDLEGKFLFTSPYFKQEKMRRIGEGLYLYVFDLTEMKETYDLVIEGRYSKIPDGIKKVILGHYKTTPSFNHVESWLYPEKYYKAYAEDLMVPLEIVGPELCNKPDFEKEKYV